MEPDATIVSTNARYCCRPAPSAAANPLNEPAKFDGNGAGPRLLGGKAAESSSRQSIQQTMGCLLQLTNRTNQSHPQPIATGRTKARAGSERYTTAL